MNSDSSGFAGIGMTSARTRDRLIGRLREQGIVNAAVLDRIRNVPRHIFVDEALASRAYEDIALPIGHGQTISQPYIVARMTEALIAGSDIGKLKVLEIGTGCGYQTAVIAPLVRSVYSIERVGPLSRKARQRLRELEIDNVKLRHGDGWRGWPVAAPFDGILVAAAPQEIPEALLSQLADGGNLVIPVGPAGDQKLIRIVRSGDDYERQSLGLVSFVPMLTGKS